MTKADLKSYESALHKLRARLSGNLSHLAGEALREGPARAAGAAESGDLGSEQQEQECNLSLLQNQEETLEEVDAALGRVRAGSFGLCEECRQPIHKARLQTLPYTRHCVACARKL